MTPDLLGPLRAHLLAALDPPPPEARRLFHGRGRRWPGLEHLTVDWLEGVLLVSLFREPEAEALAALRALLDDLAASAPWRAAAPRALLLQHRYRPDSAMECRHGACPERWTLHEDGLRYGLDLGRHQNCGLFLDMRYGRRWVREHAAGRRVLNLFAYTCAFSVAALAGGAEVVVNLDMARAALNRGRENHRLNGQPLERVSFLDHDLFKSWGALRKRGPYGLVIVDPPSFQKGSFELARDYRKVLRRLPELLEADGWVLACLNDPDTGPDFLLAAMAEEAPSLAFEARLENPPEFLDIDPDAALKVLAFRRVAAPD